MRWTKHDVAKQRFDPDTLFPVIEKSVLRLIGETIDELSRALLNLPLANLTNSKSPRSAIHPELRLSLLLATAEIRVGYIYCYSFVPSKLFPPL